MELERKMGFWKEVRYGGPTCGWSWAVVRFPSPPSWRMICLGFYTKGCVLTNVCQLLVEIIQLQIQSRKLPALTAPLCLPCFDNLVCTFENSVPHFVAIWNIERLRGMLILLRCHYHYVKRKVFIWVKKAYFLHICTSSHPSIHLHVLWSPSREDKTIQWN